MAKMVLLASFVSLNANNLSEYCSKIEVAAEVEEQDVTVFTSGGWKELLGGLAEGTLSLTFKNDFAATKLDAIMWPLFRTIIPFEVRADNAVVGTSNPKYTGSVLMNGWSPINGDVGNVAETEVSYPTSGPVLRGTA